MVLAKGRHIDQCNRIESPEINRHIWSIDFQGQCQDNSMGEKDSLFNKWCWENWIFTCKRMKSDPHLIPYAKINSKWTKDISLRIKIIKLLEENIGENLHDTGFGNDLMDMV